MTDHHGTASPFDAGRFDDWMSVVILLVFAVAMGSFLLLAAPLLWLGSLALGFGQRALAALWASGIPAVTGVQR